LNHSDINTGHRVAREIFQSQTISHVSFESTHPLLFSLHTIPTFPETAKMGLTSRDNVIATCRGSYLFATLSGIAPISTSSILASSWA
jgi:hypothetical protein